MKNIIQAINKYSDLFVILTALVFGIYFSLLSINRLDTLRSNYYDLGIMDQTVYNTSKGRFLELTNPHNLRNTSRLAIHFDPILAFFAPFYLLFPSPAVLLVIQAFLIGAGSIAVFYIGKHITENKIMGLIFALSYLFYYPNQRGVIFDFHAVLMAAPLLLFAVLFELKKKYYLMFIFLVLALLTKEHVGLTVFMYGLFLFLCRKDRSLGVIVALVGITSFLLSFKVIIPYFNQGSHFASRFFDGFNIAHIFEKIYGAHEQRYIVSILLPGIIFMLFYPLAAIPVFPELMMNALSKNGNMQSIYFHYNAVLTPFVFYASILGYRRLSVMKSRIKPHFAALAVYIIISAVMAYKFAPLPAPFASEPYEFQPINREKMIFIRLWQEKLDNEEIAVSTTPRIAPFFTRRKNFYNFLYDTGYEGAGINENDIIESVGSYKKAEYVILEKEEGHSEQKLPKMFYLDLHQNGDYEIVYEDKNFEVYRKK